MMELNRYLRELERYEFLEKLGQGGNGSVYLVRDTCLNRKVALKMMPNAEIHFFHKEVEILKSEEIKLLPCIYDAWLMQDGTGIIVMEYVQGENLSSYLESHQGISEETLQKWCIALAEFLKHIHDKTPPVLYRDLKPENIMVRKNGELAVIDFGTAVCMEQESYKDGKRIGTKGFASPEQWMGKSIDRRSDIYSLGMVMKVLYENSLYRSLELGKIIEKCTRDLPEKRYMTIHGVLKDLKEYPYKEKRKLIKERLWYVLKIVILLMIIYKLFFA